MKKTIAALLAVLMCLTLFGCGKKDADNGVPQTDAAVPATKDPADYNRLERFIYSDIIQQASVSEDDRCTMTVTVENGDTIVVTKKLKDTLTEEDRQKFVEEENAKNTEAALQEHYRGMAEMIANTGIADAVKLCLRVTAPDGTALAEYSTVLETARKNAGTDASAPASEPAEGDEGDDIVPLEEIVNSAFVQEMLAESADDEDMSMRLKAENGDTLVVEARLKHALPEGELQSLIDEIKNDSAGQEGVAEGMDMLLQLFGAMAGVDNLKCVIRVVDTDGTVLYEYTR